MAQTTVPMVLCAELLKRGVALMLVLSPLMSNTKTKAFTEAFCEQSSIPEAANS